MHFLKNFCLFWIYLLYFSNIDKKVFNKLLTCIIIFTLLCNNKNDKQKKHFSPYINTI